MAADAGQLCEICDMWLNGPEQWKERIECNKHRQGGSSRAQASYYEVMMIVFGPIMCGIFA